MQLDDIISDAADQERGAMLELADPVSGEPTGIKLKIAGPDSQTQRKAALLLADELSEMAGPDGRVTAEAREAARVGQTVSTRWQPRRKTLASSLTGICSPGPKR